ncbi:hypothetical protein [Dictyobacter aurantiacus]|uniref:Uncharacterized protein n=1 Tax=Dictyobacter aurantiacus TaxID=1936993 RepID=A0A401ZEF6_9CHLR|nr:hypothetical protein [Dictyobacter aurantiacus]GCE05229.1 hypothetical protein KDAU_25580 [Dictyobacter aurantiacus]
MPHMPRLKKVLLVKAATGGELLPHAAITIDLLPSLMLSPITDKVEAQHIRPLASVLPTTDTNIFKPQSEQSGATADQVSPHCEPLATIPPAPTIKKGSFTDKPVVIAGNTLLLGLLSYLLFRHQRAYLFLSWYLLLLLWSYLTFKPVRQLFARGMQALRHFSHPTTPPAITPPGAANYRAAHMRQLQNDTNAYLQALRDLHKKTQH